MSWARRISEHPWLSLAVSAATIVSTVLAIAAFFLSSDKAVPDHDPAGSEQVQSELVGTWILQTPPDPELVVEYKPDGTYSLASPDGVVAGFYEARNGVFTSRAPELGLVDRGRYQMLDDETLEMSGQLGVSIWKRQ
ncbi:MAG: hypothetical protein R3C13_13870 [Hyphomonas sp.]|uniref:hypothetical protein n=1 Tax=Hyphomonas sp. TaxID=87 RepID=UPI0035292E06